MVDPFEQVVREHGDVVWRVCRALLPAADADDAWQETFVAAMAAYPRLRPDSNVRGWLVTIAHRKSLDRLRVAARHAVPMGEVPERPSTDEAWTGDDDLTAALATLAPKQRTAVVARYIADLPYSEVAVLLDSNEAAARRSAADGIARLRTTGERGR